jgi:hypothetical protein
MTLNGKRDGFSTKDLLEAASQADLKTPKAKSIIRQVHAAISDWGPHAESAGVFPDWISQIQANLRLDLDV